MAKAGRPSKLTEPLRVEIGKRYAAGESIRALSREYKIPESTLRLNFSAQAQEIREVATALACAETALMRLPVSAQRSALSLADTLKATQTSYSQAAQTGASNAAKLQSLAEAKINRLDDDCEPEELRPIAALAETAKISAALATSLITGNRQRMQDDEPGRIFSAEQLRRMAQEQEA